MIKIRFLIIFSQKIVEFENKRSKFLIDNFQIWMEY